MAGAPCRIAPCPSRSRSRAAWPTSIASEWDALVGPDGSPFLEWDWLDALEQSGCVGGKTGWAPHHLTVRDDGRADRRRADVPEGPQPGRVRLRPHLGRGRRSRRHRLLPEAAGRRAVHARHRPAHPHAPRPAARAAADDGRARRCATSARRQRALVGARQLLRRRRDRAAARPPASCTARASSTTGATAATAPSTTISRACAASAASQVRRELRAVAEQGIAVDACMTGEAIADELFEPMFRLYLVDDREAVLGPAVPERSASSTRCASAGSATSASSSRQRGDELLAGAINVQKAGVLYGRYWGCFEEVRHLHFAVCYYAGIEHCIERGLTRFEPGAGGEYKHWRGFDATRHAQPALPAAPRLRPRRRRLPRPRARPRRRRGRRARRTQRDQEVAAGFSPPPLDASVTEPAPQPPSGAKISPRKLASALRRFFAILAPLGGSGSRLGPLNAPIPDVPRRPPPARPAARSPSCGGRGSRPARPTSGSIPAGRRSPPARRGSG